MNLSTISVFTVSFNVYTTIAADLGEHATYLLSLRDVFTRQAEITKIVRRNLEEQRRTLKLAHSDIIPLEDVGVARYKGSK